MSLMRRKNTTSEMMKEYIADSLLLLMAGKAYDAITIGEITKKAGVNRSTYYRNFHAKGEIIAFYFSKIISQYMNSQAETNMNSTLEYLVGMFSCFQKHKQQLLLIYQSGVSHYILEALNNMFTLATESRTFAERFQVYYHTGGIYNSFQLWFGEGMKETPEEMAQTVIQTLPNDFLPMLMRKKQGTCA